MSKKLPAPSLDNLRRLWHTMTPAERLRFAVFARSTVGSLRQYTEGRRNISPDLAIRIEKAAVRMKLPAISRTELNATCNGCEFARACLRARLT